MGHSNENTQFWLALLTYPDDTQQRTRYWNGYLAWQLPEDFRYEIRNVGNPPFNRFFQNEHLQLKKEGLRGFVWVSPDGKQCNSLCGKGIQTSSSAEKWSIFRIG